MNGSNIGQEFPMDHRKHTQLIMLTIGTAGPSPRRSKTPVSTIGTPGQQIATFDATPAHRRT